MAATRNRRARFVIGSTVVLAAVISLTTTPARAEDKTAARQHWERGTKFFDLGRYDEAIKEFEAAYQAKSDPAFLYNLAQSHRLAGHTNDALRLYRNYLRYEPKAPNRADIEQRIRELEKIASSKPEPPPPSESGPPPLSPAIPPPPPFAATSPGTATAPSGVATVTPPAVDATGTSSTGTSGAIGTEPPPGSTSSGTSPAPFAPPSSTPPALSQTGDAEAATPMSGRRKLGVVIGAVGAGVFLVGAIFGAVARNQSDKVEKAARDQTAFDPAVEDLGQASETLQWVGYGLGLAGVVTGAILYFRAPSGTELQRPSSVAVAPLISPHAGGALMRVTF